MSSAQESMAAKSPTGGLGKYVIWLAGAAILIIAPHLFTSHQAVPILNEIGIAIIFALSYNMLLGQGGMLSFGHAVYAGLGGFIAMHAMNYIGDGTLPLPMPFLPVIGGLAGLAFGIIFGSFSTNRAGTVFAMISLGIGELIAACSLIFVGFFGGEEGVTSDRTMGPEVFGYDFGPDIEVYYVIAIWVFIATLLMYLFSRTPVGRMANAVRDNPERAEFIGYSQKMVRFISFSAAGFFAGIAGGLFAIVYEIVTEENLNLATSGSVLVMAYIGGVGFFAGPIVGAIVLTLLQTLLKNYTEIWALYVGIIFVGTVMYAPAGLTGLIMMHVPAIQYGRMQGLLRLGRAYLLIGIPTILCALGTIGLLEMLHLYKEANGGETEINLFGMIFDIATAYPWVLAVVMIVGGFLLAKWMTPQLVSVWQETTHPPQRERQ